VVVVATDDEVAMTTAGGDDDAPVEETRAQPDSNMKHTSDVKPAVLHQKKQRTVVDAPPQSQSNTKGNAQVVKELRTKVHSVEHEKKELARQLESTQKTAELARKRGEKLHAAGAALKEKDSELDRLKKEIDELRRQKDEEQAARQELADCGTGMCVVCYDLPHHHAVVPCMHKVLCHGCREHHAGKLKVCPACRGPIDSWVQIYSQ
jgi:hypothetical protein